MKNVILGIMMSVIMTLVTVIILTTDDRMVRMNEDSLALANALDESIRVIDTDKYSVSDTSELISDITQGLLMQIESDSDITVNVMDADRDKGIVTVEAVENFKKPMGAAGQVAETRTIILEEKEADNAYDENNRIYDITYLTSDGGMYMAIGIKNNETLVIPEPPDGRYWLYNGSRIESSDNLKVTSDMIISQSE